MIIYKISRAPERRMYFLDVGNLPPDQVDEHVRRIMNSIKKANFIDPQTGQYNLKFNMQNILQDYVFAIRGANDHTRIDTLPGLQYQSIEAVEYLQKKMFASLRTPKSYLSFEQGVGNKANLASQDLHFAKTIQKIQRIITEQLKKIG